MKIPIGRTATLICLLLLSVATPVLAQDVEPAADEASAATRPDLEEILVTGRRSIIAIRNQIIREEMQSYKIFNDLNSDDDFDITCRKIRANSFIPKRECEPRFLTRARQGNAIMSLADIRDGQVDVADSNADGFDRVQLERGLSTLSTDREIKAEKRDLFELLNEEMLRLALENPEYRASLLRIDALKKELQAQRKKRFGD